MSSMEQRLEQLEAIHAIRNVMSRFVYCHAANRHEECLELCALDTPGARHVMVFGTYEGRAGLERLYRGFFGRLDRDPVGRMHMFTLTTPVIEVAGDLRTAKGVWTCPGHTTDRNPAGDFSASWVWTKYGCDFVLENGLWKIWHLHVYGIFATPYDKSWVDTAPDRAQEAGTGLPPMPAEIRPDRPSPGFWQYSRDARPVNDPIPPCPYQSFDDTTAY